MPKDSLPVSVDKVQPFPLVFECNPLHRWAPAVNECCVSKLRKLQYCSVVPFIELYLVALAYIGNDMYAFLILDTLGSEKINL